MKNIYNNITEVIGNTPLLRLSQIDKDLPGNIYAKLEGFNPGGSVKDRIAFSMFQNAIEKGALKPSTTIIEATSGNTGIGISMIGASLGYKVLIVMPETMSVERRALMKVYGAELVLTEGALGMKGSIAKAQELQEEIGDALILSQFDNQANVRVHYETTGPEIYKALDGNIDVLVAGIGTGGTITGAGRYLKEKNPDIKIVALEPKDSAVLSKGQPGPHKIQGWGAGFIPSILDTDIYDEILTVENEQSFEMARKLALETGYLAGISSGGALYGAIEIAKRIENIDKNIVVVFPDTGERYLSTDLFKPYI